MFLYETVECLWIHYTIPKLVSGEVAMAMKTVRHTVNMAFKNEHDLLCLDSPKYFFASRQLADAFPQLLESSVVRAFHNHFPPSNLDLHMWPVENRDKKREKKKVFPCTEWDLEDEAPVKESRKRGSRLLNFVRRFNVSALAFLVLRAIGTVSIRFQQLVIHTIQPILFSFMIILFLIIEEYPVIALIPMAIIVYEALVYANMDQAEDKKAVAAINDTEKLDYIRSVLKEKEKERDALIMRNDISHEAAVQHVQHVDIDNDDENYELTKLDQASNTLVHSAMDSLSSGMHHGYTKQQTMEEFIQEMAESEDINSTPPSEKIEDVSMSQPLGRRVGIKSQLTADELIRELVHVDGDFDLPKAGHGSGSDVDDLLLADVDDKLFRLESNVAKLERNVRRMCLDTCFMARDDFLLAEGNDKEAVISSQVSTAFASGCRRANPFSDRRTKWQRWWDDYRLFESDLILPYRNNSGYKVHVNEIQNVRALFEGKRSKIIPTMLAHQMALLQEAEHNQFTYTEQLLREQGGAEKLAKHCRVLSRKNTSTQVRMGGDGSSQV